MSVDELLARVRTRQSIPPPAERRAIRERAGISLRDLAAALNVSHATLRGWENGAMPRNRWAEYAHVLTELERAL